MIEVDLIPTQIKEFGSAEAVPIGDQDHGGVPVARDETRSRHFDLVGDHWSIDLVTVTAAGILRFGFVCAIVALWVH